MDDSFEPAHNELKRQRHDSNGEDGQDRGDDPTNSPEQKQSDSSSSGKWMSFYREVKDFDPLKEMEESVRGRSIDLLQVGKAVSEGYLRKLPNISTDIEYFAQKYALVVKHITNPFSLEEQEINAITFGSMVMAQMNMVRINYSEEDIDVFDEDDYEEEDDDDEEEEENGDQEDREQEH